MNRRPILIADAGFMYAAKMSGQAACYDFFTPDVGELAFLADEMAPHPFYTRGVYPAPKRPMCPT
jgi:ADP-dependent NAD(P)H-hydrate dehydratase / NAD(P)H-hydrate epimerase